MAQADKQKTAGNEKMGAGGLSRRNFLLLSASAVAASFLPAIAARAAIGVGKGADSSSVLPPHIDAPLDFRNFSQFLTGKEIDGKLAERAWWAMANHDPDFPAKYTVLRDYIAANHLNNIEELKDRTDLSPALRQTAMAVISAYYLGYVGAPLPLRAHDDTIFITFTQAKMYQANDDMAPINTYSRRHSGYWVSAANKS